MLGYFFVIMYLVWSVELLSTTIISSIAYVCFKIEFIALMIKCTLLKVGITADILIINLCSYIV